MSSGAGQPRVVAVLQEAQDWLYRSSECRGDDERAYAVRDAAEGVAELIAADLEYNAAINAVDVPRVKAANARRGAALARVVDVRSLSATSQAGAVLATMDLAITCLALDERDTAEQQLKDAKAAVAELIQASFPFARRNSSDPTIEVELDTADIARLRAALARVEGAA